MRRDWGANQGAFRAISLPGEIENAVVQKSPSAH